MEGVKIVDAGDRLVITGDHRTAVAAALRDLAERGSTILSDITPIGAHFTATATPPTAEPAAEPGAGDWMAELERYAIAHGISVSDTGNHMIFTAADSRDVEHVLAELEAHGIRRLGPVAPMGARWVGSCVHPSHVATPCTIESLGLKAAVSAPQREQVDAKLEELLLGGATVVSPPEFRDGRWTAIVDLGEKQQGMRFY